MRYVRYAGASALVVTLALALPRQPLEAAASCESLTSLSLPNVTITRAAPVEQGAFNPTAGGPSEDPKASIAVPRAFCRVAATLRPSGDSDIKIEVWLPAANWNHKFQAVGNGAFTGTIAYPALLAALTRGYATASTDTGHAGGSGSFGLGHPEKVVDFGWRAVHEMTVASKRIIAAYYESGPRYSYWNGCSAGGRQGLKAAQRFPADFDGIIAGAPGHDWTGRAARAVQLAQRLQKDEASRLSAEHRQLVHSAVLNACDARDGVKDGIVGDPQRCAFDPSALTCKAGSDQASCLMQPQVDTVKLLLSAQINPKSKRTISGLFPGSELGWTDLGWTASARATGLDQFRYIVFQDPKWEIDRFDFARDIARADDVDDGTINALDPNLKPFIDRGGKLIQYHGWSDPQISPGNSVEYYSRAIEAIGGAAKADPSYRLFMAPGMGHCGGGEGPNTFDMVSALEQWVEQGKAPDSIVASRRAAGAVERTRPLCPFPKVAVYSGSGSTDEAANFVCQAP